MPIRVTDKLVFPSRGTADIAVEFLKSKGAKRADEAEVCVRETYRLCGLVGLDAAIAVARMADETGDDNGPAIFVSPIWRDRLNPAGMGVTDGGDEKITFADGKTAARAYVAHLMTYVYGSDFSKGGLSPNDDPRYSATPEAWRGSVKTLMDLEGKWFTQQGGAQNSADRGNAIYPGLAEQEGVNPVSTATGHVPKPPMIQHYGAGFNHNIGSGRSPDQQRQGRIVGSCVHTSQGSYRGNESVFDDPNWGGLTDAQVGGPWDGIFDGVLEEFIDPASMVVPWANGGVEDAVPAHGDGPAFLHMFGAGAVNPRLRSIETTDGGDPSVAKGGRQIESLCFYLAYVHAEEAGQTAGTFNWRMSHWEFGGEHQQCPGTWIKGHETAINDRTKAIMRAYQEGVALDPPLLVTYPPGWTEPEVPIPVKGIHPGWAEPEVPPFVADDVKAGAPQDHDWKGTRFHALARQFVAIRPTRRLKHATVKAGAEVVGPRIEAGEAIPAWWWFRSNKRTWVLMTNGTRVSAAALSPKITITP